ncbi:MAG: VanW family protein [Firmicutes bacterium]|nr:VanW family protein [Bacillota bacterium]
MRENKFYKILILITLLVISPALRGDILVRTDNKFYIATEEKRFVFSDAKFKRFGDKTFKQRVELLKTPTDIDKYLPEITKLINRIERDVNCNAFQGNVKFSPNGKLGARAGEMPMFTVGEQTLGKRVNTQMLYADLFDALTQNKKEVRVHIDSIKPSKTPQQIVDALALRSKFTTSFRGSIPERINNIKRSLAQFNGLVVPNGCTVSFNQQTNPRTVENGYKAANMILDGEFVLATGGGVCQSSTTLYNAFLRAGLTVLESHQHSLPISYVPLGLDAMVNGSARDLRVQNTTGDTVYVKTYTDGTRAVVEIYGNKLNGVKYATRVEHLGNNSVISFLDTYKQGRKIDTRKLRKSNYIIKEKKEEVSHETIELIPQRQSQEKHI